MATQHMEDWAKDQHRTWQHTIKSKVHHGITLLENGVVNSVTIDLEGVVPVGIRNAIGDKMVKQLISKGYKANYESGSSYRETWSYVTFSLGKDSKLVSEFSLF